ncbi:MAG: hypothetical protein NVV73_19670 [Cellvibrionaceae bacterium]|nr:hypothetical protein [Cellvibrionaceae bacterium]
MSKALPINEEAGVFDPTRSEASASGIDARNLDAAMEFFQRTSRQLSNSYSFLESKVAQLTRELDVVSAQKDDELEKKIASPIACRRC